MGITTKAGMAEIVATPAGLSLYVYKPDTPAAGATMAKSTCGTGCITAWPAFYAPPPVTAPTGLNASDFGSFDRGGGVMQSTYMGWPLYTYHDDKKLGDIHGDEEAGVWFLVKVPFVAPK
jgi:predicted lipoprotein with Yx(FWY)xxD motif